jgi:hypothetical protein
MARKKVKAEMRLGTLQTITLDRLRFFNPKSPFRRAVNEAYRFAKDTGWTPPVYFSKTDEMENGLLLLIFNNTNFANIGDATGLRGSSTAGSFYVALHTADPGETGDQTTSEIGYTLYARVAVARSGAGWTVTASSVSNAASITFPTGGVGSSPIASHGSIGTASTSTGHRLYNGSISPAITCGNGITPILTTASTITED